jgi:hypothetical protein
MRKLLIITFIFSSFNLFALNCIGLHECVNLYNSLTHKNVELDGEFFTRPPISVLEGVVTIDQKSADIDFEFFLNKSGLVLKNFKVMSVRAKKYSQSQIIEVTKDNIPQFLSKYDKVNMVYMPKNKMVGLDAIQKKYLADLRDGSKIISLQGGKIVIVCAQIDLAEDIMQEILLLDSDTTTTSR